MSKHRLKSLFAVAGFVLMMGLLLCVPVDSYASTYAIPYKVENGQSLLPGMVVVLNGEKRVRAALQTESDVILGTVANLPPNALPNGYLGVTSSGLASVLVSDLSGTIVKGDRVAISPILGVGMKAVSSGWVIGVAQEDFNSSNSVVTHQNLKSPNGAQTDVSVKSISVLLSITHYDPQGGIVIGTAQGIVDLVAGHSVSVGKTVTALIIFAIAVIVMVVMIYTAVKSSLMSIGRNPLASGTILRALTRAMLYMLIVIIIAMVVIYFVVVT